MFIKNGKIIDWGFLVFANAHFFTHIGKEVKTGTCSKKHYKNIHLILQLLHIFAYFVHISNNSIY